jgi:hypothetical protein
MAGYKADARGGGGVRPRTHVRLWPVYSVLKIFVNKNLNSHKNCFVVVNLQESGIS